MSWRNEQREIRNTGEPKSSETVSKSSVPSRGRGRLRTWESPRSKSWPLLRAPRKSSFKNLMMPGISTWRTMKRQRSNRWSGWRKSTCRSWHRCHRRCIMRHRQSWTGRSSWWKWGRRKRYSSLWGNTKMRRCAGIRPIRWRNMKDSSIKSHLRGNL